MTYQPRTRNLGYTCRSEDGTIEAVPSSAGPVVCACVGFALAVVLAAVFWFAMRNVWIGLGVFGLSCLPVLLIFVSLRREVAGGPAWLIDLKRGEMTIGGPPAKKIEVKDICRLQVKKESRSIASDGQQYVYTVQVVLGSLKNPDEQPIASFTNWHVANRCASRTAELIGVDFQPV